MKKMLISVFVLACNFIFAQFGIDQKLVEIEPFLSQSNAYPGSTVKLAVKLSIADTWHINSDKPNDEFLIPSELLVESENEITVDNITYPEAKNITLSFSEQPVSVFEGEEYIYANIIIPAATDKDTLSFKVVFHYQACNNESCMPPSSVETDVSIKIADLSEGINVTHGKIFAAVTATSQIESGSSADDSITAMLESSGLLLSFIIVFLGGLALNLTPCVYPLIPITVGYFGGQSEGKTSRLFLLGIVYVLGMALTYSIIGVVTAMSGAVFGALLQNPLVIIAISLVLVVLSLSMFGVYEFKLPDSLVAKAGGAKTGIFGAFFMGLTLGIVAAPCIGPFVIGLLTVVAAKGDALYGFLMFFFLALGLGAPYLILAMFSGKIKNLPRAGFWMDGVKHIFGFLLLGMALYFIGPLIPKEINYYLLPVFIIVAGLYLIFFDKNGNDVKGFKIFKYVFSIIIITVAGYFLYPSEAKSPEWKYFTDQIFEDAIDANQRIVIDFYADWCIPCKELDALTFSDERVIEESEEFVMIKVDMTKTMSDETERIRNKFNIIGMPTVLVFNSDGREVERITGFVNAEEFLKIIREVK